MLNTTIEKDFLNTFTVLKSTDQIIVGANPSAKDCKMSGLPTIKTVCNGVVMKLHDLDTTSFGKTFINQDHWNRFNIGHATVAQGADHLAHAIINVNDTETALDVADYLNGIFKNNPVRFPRDKGWHAIATYNGCNPKHSLTNSDNPFMYYRNCRRVNNRVSRILVVVDMAKEGLNNRFINVWGAARDTSSKRDAVQRIGRVLRTGAVWSDSRDTVSVPSASHDTVFIITHEDLHNTVRVIPEALEFVKNSRSIAENVMTIQDYINLDDVDDDEDNTLITAQLTMWERFRMGVRVGSDLLSGRNPNYGRIVRDTLGTSNKIKRAKIQKAMRWVEAAYVGTANFGGEKNLAISDLKSWSRSTIPDFNGMLIGEKLVLNAMNLDDCVAWLKGQAWGAGLLAAAMTPEAFVASVNDLHAVLGNQLGAAKMDIRELPGDRIRALILDLNERSGYDVKGDVEEVLLEVFSAICEGVTLDDFEEGGRLCSSEMTYTLRDPKFNEQLRDHIVFRLIETGRLNELSAVLRM